MNDFGRDFEPVDGPPDPIPGETYSWGETSETGDDAPARKPTNEVPGNSLTRGVPKRLRKQWVKWIREANR